MAETFRIAPPSESSRRSAVGLGVFFLVMTAVFLLVGLAAAAIGPLVGAAAMFYVAQAMRSVTFLLTSDVLKIQGNPFGRTIPRAALAARQARIVSLETEADYQPVLRTLGTAWPGYLAGWFRLRSREKGLVFITDRTRVIYVPTTLSYSLLVSVEQPGEFLQALQEGKA